MYVYDVFLYMIIFDNSILSIPNHCAVIISEFDPKLVDNLFYFWKNGKTEILLTDETSFRKYRRPISLYLQIGFIDIKTKYIAGNFNILIPSESILNMKIQSK